jgi:L-fuconolactonase
MASGADFSGRVDEAWLAQHREEIIEPELSIVDAHHHLWHHSGNVYLFPELLADLSSGHHIRATVFEECGSMYRADGPEELRSLGETEFVTGVAAMSASGGFGPTRACAVMVGNVNLNLGSRVEPILDAHIAASGGRFHAIRFSTAWDADERVHKTVPRPRMLAEPRFREGFQFLARFDLAFDAWVYHPQLSEIAELAKSFPGTPIVLNHFGSPILGGPNAGRVAEAFAEWRAAMTALASHDNVHVKLGALPVRRSGGRPVPHRFLLRTSPQHGGPSSRSASRNLALIGACSRAISRFKSAGAATQSCRMPASVSRPAPPLQRSPRSLVEPPREFTAFPLARLIALSRESPQGSPTIIRSVPTGRYLIAKTGRLTFVSRRAYAKPRGSLQCALI